MSSLVRAWLSWKSAKAVALMSALALTVGIGSTTAIYTVVNAVMLRPLPYKNGERFVALFGATTTDPKHYSSNTFDDLLAYQHETNSFDVFGWFRMNTFNLTAPGTPQHIDGVLVTPELAQGLGVSLIAGEWFHDDSGAVISEALWNRLGGDRSIIGKAMALNGHSYTVTGVMPGRFRLPIAGPYGDVRTDVWLYLDSHGRGQNPNEAAYFGYARLRPGETRAQAEAEVKRVAAEIAKRQPASHPSYTAKVDDLQELLSRDVRPALLLLFAAAGLLLLITCANVAGLLLVRSVARARETAIRVALGAGTRQLAAQYFLEGLVVSLAGAAGGVLLSVGLVRIVVSLAAATIPRAEEVALDGTALLFALGAAFLASALSSLAPLWQAIRTPPNEILTDGVRASASGRSRRLSRSLVIAEIALAFALLAVSAALLDHLRNLGRTSPGFDPSHLLTFEVTLSDELTSNEQKRAVEETGLIRALEAIPGVSAAGFVNQLPLAGCCMSTSIYPEGRPASLDVSHRTSLMVVSPTYFQTMRIPLRAGRLLSDQDAHPNLLLTVINDSAARYYWPDRDPVGVFGRFLRPNGTRFQVIGVVGDVRNDGLQNPTVSEVYLLGSVVPTNPLVFVVRSTRAVESLLTDVRRAIQSVDRLAPIHKVATMDEIATQSLSIERASSFMMTFFAAAALLMATLGVYGVVSYSVRQRTVELGTRMALGAVSGDVVKLVVGAGLRMALWGCLLGGVAVLLVASRLSQWFDIQDLRLLPLLASLAVAGGVALGASFFPAWRATFLAPASAIRNLPEPLWRSVRQRLREGRAARREADPAETVLLADATLLTEFVEAARRAGSFDEALQISLATLCARLDAESALLLESDAEGVCRTVAAFPLDRLAADSASRWKIPTHGFLLNRLKFYDFPLPLSSGDFDTWLRWAAENRPQHLAEIETLRSVEARLAVALRTRSEMLGVLLLGPPVDREVYSFSERRLLKNCAEQFALMMENARLTDRMVEQEKLRRDVALAAEVQKRLMPEQPPVLRVATLAAMSLPARTVGGDYYDFLDLGERGVGIALADVAGKGVAAALIMSVVQASLRILASDESLTLPQVVARMNRFLHRSTRSNSYATFFYGQIDEGNRELRYVNAGHNPPYLFRARAGIEELSTGGAVIGLFPQMSFEEGTLRLRPGDVLIAFTDGVTEAMSPAEEEFGEDRLKELVQGLVHLSPSEISARVSEELRNWMKDAPQHDDLTLIVMKVS